MPPSGAVQSRRWNAWRERVNWQRDTVQKRVARLIIPLAIGLSLAFSAVALLPDNLQRPGVAVLAVIAVAVCAYVVFRLLAASGWDLLAKRFRARAHYVGKWQTIPTAQIAPCSIDDADYASSQARLVGTLKAAAADDGLHFSILLAKVPVLGLMFPEIHIPWSEILGARTYEAPGWVSPQATPGTVIQAGYDPNYKGRFVELKVGQPTVYIQLPVTIFGDQMDRLSQADESKAAGQR